MSEDLTIDLERVKTISVITIATAEQEKGAIDGFAFVQSVRRNLEKARKEMVDPLNAKVKEINGRFRALLDPVEAAEEKVNRAILDWRRREATRIEAERQRVREENERRERVARQEQARLLREAQERERVERERVADETAKEAAAVGFTADDAAELGRLEATSVATASVPVVVAPVREAMPSAPPATVRGSMGGATIRRVVSPGLIQAAIDAACPMPAPMDWLSIPGVRIFETWTFEIIDAKAVPDAYREDSLAGRR